MMTLCIEFSLWNVNKSSRWALFFDIRTKVSSPFCWGFLRLSRFRGWKEIHYEKNLIENCFESLTSLSAVHCPTFKRWSLEFPLRSEPETWNFSRIVIRNFIKSLADELDFWETWLMLSSKGDKYFDSWNSLWSLSSIFYSRFSF